MITAGSLFPFTATLNRSVSGAQGTGLNQPLKSAGSNCSVEKSGQPWAVYPAGSVGQPTGPSIAFGAFRLYPRQRLLLEETRPLRIGSRALDILIALVERAGELVSKKELIARVWPGVIVEDANLKVHVAALRRILRDGKGKNRYICTVPGRGYSFVAPVTQSDLLGTDVIDWSRGCSSAPVFERDQLIRMLATQLSERRFATVVGAGNTAKWIFLAAALMTDYQHGVRCVNLALTHEPLLVPSAVAAAMGLDAIDCDPLASVTAFLENKHMLLVLDNCGRVIEATAAFALSILQRAPGVHILGIGP